MPDKFYMTRSEELDKYRKLCALNGEPTPPDGSMQCFKEMFEGHPDAFNLAWSFWNFEHALDDVIDESGCDDESKGRMLFHVEQIISSRLTDEAIYLNQSSLPENLFHSLWIELIGACGWGVNRISLANEAKEGFFRELWTNEFAADNGSELRGMFVMALMRCIAGDAMKSSDNIRSRLLACAVSCADVDVIMHMIYLCRGWEVANRFSVARDYDVPDSMLEGVM